MYSLNEKDKVPAALDRALRAFTAHGRGRGELLEAVTQELYAVFTEEYSHQRASVLAAVRKNGLALKEASEAFQADKDVVLAAVTQNGLALKDASKAFQADKDVVLAAVTQNGIVLKDVSEAFQADKDVVLAAVRQNRDALRYASIALQIELQPKSNIARAGFFGGAVAMAATLSCSPTAYALVTGLMVFLPHVAAIALAVAVCGLAIALLALGVHAAIYNGMALLQNPKKLSLSNYA